MAVEASVRPARMREAPARAITKDLLRFNVVVFPTEDPVEITTLSTG